MSFADVVSKFVFTDRLSKSVEIDKDGDFVIARKNDRTSGEYFIEIGKKLKRQISIFAEYVYLQFINTIYTKNYMNPILSNKKIPSSMLNLLGLLL